MSDILDRIREAETMPLDSENKHILWEVLQDSRTEIARLREAIRRLADQDATLSVCNRDITVEMDAVLSDEEREALEVAAKILVNEPSMNPAQRKQWAATILGIIHQQQGEKL